MRSFLASFFYVVAVSAQQPDAKLHSAAWELVKLDGSLQRVQESIPLMVETARKEVMRICVTCSPKFGNEYALRMRQRVKANDFGDVLARVYEKYLSYDEIEQLIMMERAKGTAKPFHVSPALQRKLQMNLPMIQRDIKEGSVQLGKRIGSEVGGEIGKEHPEYLIEGKK